MRSGRRHARRSRRAQGITIGRFYITNTIGKLISTLQNLDDISWATVAVSAGVIGTIVGLKLVTNKIPGALIAVIGAIFVSWYWDLAAHGVATLGSLPSGLPSLGLPDVSWSDVPSLIGTATSIFILILAQSAATSRAYAAKYNDHFDENIDLVGLSASCAMAGLSGTFVVNGSPTKTQMVDGAGGRSQFAQVTTGIIVAIVLLFLTVPIQYMPKAVLASVVFLIGIELVDYLGMRKVLTLRPDEFVVAGLVTLTVVVVGVEQGIILAIVASIIDHIRKSYRPSTAVLVPTPGSGTWHGTPVEPDARSLPGLVVYRFAGSLYYANASHFFEQLGDVRGVRQPAALAVRRRGRPPRHRLQRRRDHPSDLRRAPGTQHQARHRRTDAGGPRRARSLRPHRADRRRRDLPHCRRRRRRVPQLPAPTEG